jgi:hypothetical protein
LTTLVRPGYFDGLFECVSLPLLIPHVCLWSESLEVDDGKLWVEGVVSGGFAVVGLNSCSVLAWPEPMLGIGILDDI